MLHCYHKKYRNLIDDGDKNRKEKYTNKCFIKQELKFEDYKNVLEARKLEKEINPPEKYDIEKIV